MIRVVVALAVGLSGTSAAVLSCNSQPWNLKHVSKLSSADDKQLDGGQVVVEGYAALVDKEQQAFYIRVSTIRYDIHDDLRRLIYIVKVFSDAASA
jgi:hypothetical protein